MYESIFACNFLTFFSTKKKKNLIFTITSSVKVQPSGVKMLTCIQKLVKKKHVRLLYLSQFHLFYFTKDIRASRHCMVCDMLSSRLIISRLRVGSHRRTGNVQWKQKSTCSVKSNVHPHEKQWSAHLSVSNKSIVETFLHVCQKHLCLLYLLHLSDYIPHRSSVLAACSVTRIAACIYMKCYSILYIIENNIFSLSHYSY